MRIQNFFYLILDTSDENVQCYISFYFCFFFSVVVISVRAVRSLFGPCQQCYYHHAQNTPMREDMKNAQTYQTPLMLQMLKSFLSEQKICNGKTKWPFRAFNVRHNDPWLLNALIGIQRADSKRTEFTPKQINAERFG